MVIRLALAVMRREDDVLFLGSKTLREKLDIDVMEQLRDMAAASGGGASSMEPAPAEVSPMPPEIIVVRRVAVTMEAMQVADIEKETTWEPVSIIYANAPKSVVAQLRKLRLTKEVRDDPKKTYYGMNV